MTTVTYTEGETGKLTRTTVHLPEAEQDRIRAVRASGNLPELRQLVLAYRRAKWPLRAIGDPVGAPRSTVRLWELNSDAEAPIPTVPEAPAMRRERGERVAKLRLDVPPEDRVRLKRLAESAKQVRGRTPKTAKVRQDAEQLDTLISEYIRRGIPVKRIAERMEVTPRAVTARHERYLERQANAEDE